MNNIDILSITFINRLKDIVYDAGTLIIDATALTDNTNTVNNTPDTYSIHSKEGTFNFVTKYDSMVQTFLIDHLSLLLPEAKFLGEEDGKSNVNVEDGYAFIIDPIDGTTNFICGFMCSGISVGLSLNGKVLLGVIYNPFRNEMFYASEGHGAYLNNKRIEIVDKGLSDGVTIFGTTPYNPELRDDAFELAKKISYHTMDLRELGAASICLCYAACGRAIIYASPRLSVWDYAAGSIIMKEAGGCIYSFDGSELNLRSKVSVVAGSKKGVEEFLKLI